MGCGKRGEVLEVVLGLAMVMMTMLNRLRYGTVYHHSTSTAPDPWLLNSCSACISTFFLLSSLRTSTSTDSRLHPLATSWRLDPWLRFSPPIYESASHTALEPE
ncbi:hypothetical protein J3E68DRAFT_391380 [Trichoderma sp. SZMC 28012]